MFIKFWNGKLTGLLGAVILGITILFEKVMNYFISFLVRHNIKKCGKNLKIHIGFVYRYPKYIEIGNNVIIGKHTTLSSEGLSTQYLKIESGVSIGNMNKIDFSGGITIRENAHIAHNVLISTHDHGYDYRNEPMGKPLEIGKNAFIGSHCIILHNVNYIGKNALVGTGAVVTKNVPDNAIVAGNPGKILKYVNDEQKS